MPKSYPGMSVNGKMVGAARAKAVGAPHDTRLQLGRKKIGKNRYRKLTGKRYSPPRPGVGRKSVSQ